MATRGVLPSHSVTACTGCFSINSVSRLARRFWNNRGHGVRPARFTIFSKVVRRLAFIQPVGPFAALRNFSYACLACISYGSRSDDLESQRSTSADVFHLLIAIGEPSLLSRLPAGGHFTRQRVFKRALVNILAEN